MAAPLYFLPGLNRAQLCPRGELSRDLLASRGLGEVLSDVTTAGDVSLCDVTAGPSGGDGCVLVALPIDRNRYHEIRYCPKKQDWSELIPGKLWLGIEPMSLPTPEDLARKKIHQGYRMELGDGERWMVPVVRRPDSICEQFGVSKTELPRDLIYDQAGQFQQVIQKAYQAVWGETGEVCDLFFSPDGVARNLTVADLAWGLEKCIRILSLNYRIDVRVHNRPRLIKPENVFAVLAGAIDQPTALALLEEFNESQKKSNDPVAPDGASSMPGIVDAQ